MFSQRRGTLIQISPHMTVVCTQALGKVLCAVLALTLSASNYAVLWQMCLLLGAAKKSQTEVYRAARGLYGERASSGISTAASGAMSTVGAVWSFVSAEAATDGSLAPEDAAPLPPPPKMDISVSLSVLSEGMRLALRVLSTQHCVMEIRLLVLCSLHVHWLWSILQLLFIKSQPLR